MVGQGRRSNIHVERATWTLDILQEGENDSHSRVVGQGVQHLE